MGNAVDPVLEVHLRREGEVLHLVSRYRPRGLLVVIGLVAVLGSAYGLSRVSQHESLRLACSRATDLCVLSDGDRTLEQFPLSGTLRFEVRHVPGKRNDWSLVAVTRTGDVSLLWAVQQRLAPLADELNAFLGEPTQDGWAMDDPRGPLRAAAVPLVVAMNVLLIASLIYMATDRETVFDRARGRVVRRLGLIPSSQSLQRFRAVRVRSLREESRVRLFPTTQYERRRILLVAADGSAWPVTPHAAWYVDAVAAELAQLLGLPLEGGDPRGPASEVRRAYGGPRNGRQVGGGVCELTGGLPLAWSVQGRQPR